MATFPNIALEKHLTEGLCNVCTYPLVQIFGGNMDIKTERRHYLNVPMATRYIRIHPLTWRKNIGLRLGYIIALLFKFGPAYASFVLGIQAQRARESPMKVFFSLPNC